MTFGTASTGETVEDYVLTAGALSVTIISWGAIVQDVRLAGVDYSLTLGADNIADYETTLRHHGSLIGPIVNRISNARIKIDSMMYELERNQDGRINLHSGKQATHRRNWDVTDRSASHVTLSCALTDGACGLPGNRVMTVTYRVTAPATLSMEITGTTDATTAMSPANHSYWNLDGSQTWDGHMLQIAANRYLPTTQDNCPTGEIVDVTDTEMDFRKMRGIALRQPPFDHNFCLSDGPVTLREVLCLRGASGVTMRVATTAPGIQVYDNRDGARPGRQPYEGLAFEAQNWPDAPNHTGFPSILLRPDETYHQHTTWSFGTD